jgi:hypothetical protein
VLDLTYGPCRHGKQELEEVPDVSCVKRCSLNLVQDLLAFSPSDIALGIPDYAMLGEVLRDRVNQLARAAEAAGQDRLLAQVSEEALVKCSSRRGRRASQRFMTGSLRVE